MPAKLSFSAAIEDWVRRVKGAEKEVFQRSVQAITKAMQANLTEMIYDQPESPNYRRTGFLRASLVASTEVMPQLTRPNPDPKGTFPENLGDVILVINGADIGDTIYLGYTAEYGGMVAFGANGRPPRPWVDLAVQRWPEIVAEQAAKVKQELGL